jgi:hypothetical protein|tara:strand:+ start:1487 stop:2698 length:1212 start_codon:yes stop_codon:yes gene_type:complete
MAEEYITKSMNLLPEYQEKYLKDLLANIYQTDEATGEVSGIASQSPLFGNPVLDEEGNPMYEAADGSGFTSDVSLAKTDQYGTPIEGTEGGVAAPDVMRFTDAQTEALRRMTGYTDPETGEVVYESGIGAYKDYLDKAESTYDKGIASLDASTAQYDPLGQIQYDESVDPATGEVVRTPRLDAQGNPVRTGGYKDFYDPFVEDVIDATYADIDRAGAIENVGQRAQSVGAGAFGGSRQALQESELQRNLIDQKARTGSQLRSAAYTGAQNQAQSAFENQQKRGQNAGQLFQGLGTGIGALGEATQSLGMTDINSLFNVGQLEQNQLQKEYDVQRAGQLEEAYEPFSRFSYMRDVLSGVPSSGTSLAAAATPQASPMSNVMAGANIYGGAQGQGNIFGGLGALR